MKSQKIDFSLKYAWSLFLIINLMISCNDFLEVVPEDRIDANAFNVTDEELLISLTGAYRSFGLSLQVRDAPGSSLFQMLEARSDNTFMDHTDNRERVEIDIFQESPGNLPLDGAWAAFYRTINAANLVIDAGNNVEVDSELVKRIIGEAKFIRAFNYYYMVNLWGGLPLRTNPTTDFGNTTMARSSVTDVYNSIVQDLVEAIQVLPDSYNGSTGNEVGRATKYAALTLLGKVELQRGNKEAAEVALRQVLGKFSLLENFGDIYEPGNNNSAESIFEVDFNPEIQTGSIYWQLIPNSVAMELGIVAGGQTREIVSFGATQDLIDSFDDPNDLRIPHTFGLLEEGALPGGYITKFLDLTANSNGSDVNFVFLRYADVLLMLAEAIGEGTEAYDLINLVRNRANLPDIDASTPGTFMEKLMNERRLEFAFEMHRWLDLLRLPENEIIDLMNTQLSEQQEFFTAYPIYVFGTDFNLTSDDLLFPIPQAEIDISDGVVEQNPGY